MSIPENVCRKIKCCLFNDDHIVNEPILLDCGCNACTDCIDDSNGCFIKCLKCDVLHDVDQVKLRAVNREAENFVQNIYFKDLIWNLRSKYQKTIDGLKKTVLDGDVKYRMDVIENDIDIRIESIIDELHQLRDEFKNELKSLKEKLEKLFSILRKKLEEYREQLSLIQEKNNVNNFVDFIEVQNVLRKSEVKINEFKKQIQQIGFIASEKPIEKNIIGHLKKPFIEYNKLNSITQIDYDAQELRRFTYLKSLKSIIITDTRNGSLNLIDLNGNLIKTFRPSNISSPSCICVNKKEQIFVCDLCNWKILVFELKSDLNIVRFFKLSNVSFVSDMRVDQDGDKSLLYVSSLMDNRISIWNSDNGVFVKSIKVDHPSYMEFNRDRLYVVSYTICEENQTNQLVRINDGMNCIFVLDKTTHLMISKIEIKSWLKPCGLNFDSYSNLVTTAYELDENGFISANRYIYVLSEDGLLLNKIEIDGILRGYYLQFIDGKLVVSYDKSIKFIQFD